MKKEAIILALLIISFPLVSASLLDWFKDIMKSPSQDTEIKVRIGNVAPVITNIQSILDVDLNPSPSTTDVIFTFSARDKNSVNDLNDATASAQFTKSGETTRTGSCTFQSQTGNERTYQCTIAMQYYDGAGTWNAEVSIQDQAGLTGTDSSAFQVNQLKAISISPTTINFPTVSQGDIDVISSQNTIITNNGNFVVPLDGQLSITAHNLIGEDNPIENIPAGNFKASGSSGAGNVCTIGGNTLVDNSQVDLTNLNLGRGLSKNTEDITYCLTLVPTAISTQFYSAIGGNRWTIGI